LKAFGAKAHAHRGLVEDACIIFEVRYDKSQ